MSKLKLDSGLNFFVISMDYKKNLLLEIFYLIQKGFSYFEVLSMPIFIRKYYVEYLLENKI